MSKENIYDPSEFSPNEQLKSRYALKIVNNRFYGTIKIGEKTTSNNERELSEERVSFAKDNYEFYKDRNPWMAAKYLFIIIKEMEDNIIIDHGEK